MLLRMGTFNTYISVVAPKYQLPEQLVRAIVLVESNGDRFAWNPEPAYRYLFNVKTRMPFRALTPAEQVSETPPADFPTAAGDRDAEWWGQQASWGLMQVMGGVARELGFAGHFPGLCDPLEGLHYGCRHLAQLIERFSKKHGLRGAVGAYNAGSPRYVGNTAVLVNQGYVDKVAAQGGFKGLA